jgi:CheY-like chemotaxis protein/heme oxygenase
MIHNERDAFSEWVHRGALMAVSPAPATSPRGPAEPSDSLRSLLRRSTGDLHDRLESDLDLVSNFSIARYGAFLRMTYAVLSPLEGPLARHLPDVLGEGEGAARTRALRHDLAALSSALPAEAPVPDIRSEADAFGAAYVLQGSMLGGAVIARALLARHAVDERSLTYLRLADSGQGIAADFLPHVFERFRQADGSLSRKSGGLGLGLAIVRHIVELHGGTVSAFSEGEGKGSSFTVRLPVAIARRRDAGAGVRSPAAQFDCPPSLDGLRVLIVDDEVDARELLQAILEECHANVAAAGSAAEGLELLSTFQPDVLVSDIGMPEVDGFAFIKAVRARPAESGGRVPAIALTAYARVTDRTRVLYAAFQSHVPKPVEPTELLAVIASLTR